MDRTLFQGRNNKYRNEIPSIQSEENSYGDTESETKSTKVENILKLFQNFGTKKQ